MNRVTWTSKLRVLGAAAGLAFVAFADAGCAVGVEGDYPGGYYDDYPPDAYIATTDPVYFDGHASYYYGGNWYWRDGGQWRHYDHEPRGLYEQRMRAAPSHHSYEPNHGHFAAHPMARGGGGGRHH